MGVSISIMHMIWTTERHGWNVATFWDCSGTDSSKFEWKQKCFCVVQQYFGQPAQIPGLHTNAHRELALTLMDLGSDIIYITDVP